MIDEKSLLELTFCENFEELVNEAYKEDYIGNYDINESQLDDLIEYVGNVIKYYSNKKNSHLSLLMDKLIFLTIVNVAKTWELKDIPFFEYISKKIIGLIDDDFDSNRSLKETKIYKQIVSSIESLDKSKEIFVLKDKSKLRDKKNYSTILAHAFAPLSSIESFFELCWKIYSEDLQYDYNENDSTFYDIVVALQNFIKVGEKSDDEIKIRSTAYQIRAGIKGLIKCEPLKMEKLIQQAICNIDKLFNGTEYNANDYYSNILLNWWTKYSAHFGSEIKNLTKKEKIIKDYSNILPRYKLIDGLPCIYIPPIRIRHDLNPVAKLHLYIDDNEPISKEMIEFCNGIFVNTEEQLINLNNLSFNSDLLNIQIKIEINNKIIYDSKDKLNRKFILFKDNIEILCNKYIPGNYQLYILNFKNILQYPKNINMINKNLYSFYSEEREIFQTNDDTIIFSSNFHNDNNLYFKMKPQQNISYTYNSKEYFIIDGDINIIINKTYQAKNYGIKFFDGGEEVIFNLTEFCKTTLNDNEDSYNISEIVLDGETQDLIIFEYSSNKILDKLNILKFEDLSVIYDKNYYYGNIRNGIVKLHSKNYNKEINFDINQEHIFINFKNGELTLHPPIISWSIDNGPKQCYPNKKGIWYEDISNSSILNINVPHNIIYDLSSTILCNINTNCQNKNEYKIGDYIYSQVDKKNNNNNLKSILLFLKINNNEKLELTRFYIKETFTINPLDFSLDKHMYWNPLNKFIGNINSSFIIELKQNKEIIKIIRKNYEVSSEDLSDLESGKYTINIGKENGIFTKTFVSLFNEFEIYLGNPKIDKFKNKKIKISKIVFPCLANNVSHCFPYHNLNSLYIENIKYMGNDKGFDFYYGYLTIIGKDGRKEIIKRWKNEYNEFEKINPVRIELKDNRSFWMVYGLDSFKIANDNYLAEFTFDKFNSKLSINDRNTSGIDYYLFEESEE